MPGGRKKEAPFRTCEVCNSQFYRPPSYQQWGMQTCSRKCAAVLRNKGENRTCKQCGKDFYVRRSQLKQGFGIYCSKACNGIADRVRVDVSCFRCGTVFGATPYMIETRTVHFCSLECKLNIFKQYGIRPGYNRFKVYHQKWLADRCARCGATERLELDHIVPRFAGGKATKENVQTLCKPCNLHKFWREDLPNYLLIPQPANTR